VEKGEEKSGAGVRKRGLKKWLKTLPENLVDNAVLRTFVEMFGIVRAFSTCRLANR